MEEQESQPQKSSWLGFMTFIVVVVLGCAGFWILKMGQHPEYVVRTDLASDFDVEKVAEQAPMQLGAVPVRASNRMSPKPVSGGLAIWGLDNSQGPPVGRPGQGSSQASEKSWAEIARQEEPKMRSIWRKYINQYPSVRDYEAEWMKNAQLAGLTARYRSDHDPATFVKGLSNTPGFYKLIVKYIHQPGIMPLFQADLLAASPEAHKKAGEAFESDAKFSNFIKGLGDATGLPLAAIVGGQKVNEKDMLNSILKNAGAQQQQR